MKVTTTGTRAQVVLLLAAVALLWTHASARDFTFTFKLAAGRSECFYDYIHEGAFLEIEYQVKGADIVIHKWLVLL